MSPLTSSSSVQQYVSHLHQQMMDHNSPPFVKLDYAAEAEAALVEPQVVPSLAVEVALSRQFRRVS